MLWVSLVLDICSERKGYESSHGEWLTLEESFVESKKQICLCKNIDMQTVWYTSGSYEIKDVLILF